MRLSWIIICFLALFCSYAHFCIILLTCLFYISSQPISHITTTTTPATTTTTHWWEPSPIWDTEMTCFETQKWRVLRQKWRVLRHRNDFFEGYKRCFVFVLTDVLQVLIGLSISVYIRLTLRVSLCIYVNVYKFGCMWWFASSFCVKYTQTLCLYYTIFSVLIFLPRCSHIYIPYSFQNVFMICINPVCLLIFAYSV